MTVELRESPGGHLAAACAEASVPGVVALREVPFLGQAEVRGPDDAAVGRVAGAAPVAGRAVRGDRRTVLWCGPGWCLVVSDGDAAAPEWVRFTRGGGPEVSVADTSAARTTLELRGPYARDVLAHGCRLDLHSRVFTPGAAARTNVAKATVVLHRPDDAYRLYVGSSYADYLVTWLLDAMTPYVTEVR